MVPCDPSPPSWSPHFHVGPRSTRSPRRKKREVTGQQDGGPPATLPGPQAKEAEDEDEDVGLKTTKRSRVMMESVLSDAGSGSDDSDFCVILNQLCVGIHVRFIRYSSIFPSLHRHLKKIHNVLQVHIHTCKYIIHNTYIIHTGTMVYNLKINFESSSFDVSAPSAALLYVVQLLKNHERCAFLTFDNFV